MRVDVKPRRLMVTLRGVLRTVVVLVIAGCCLSAQQAKPEFYCYCGHPLDA